MRKKIRFPTVSLGSEPEKPDMSALIRFIGSHRGQDVDLITFHLTDSLSAQIEAEISNPGAGGLFCRPRMEKAITCSRDECYCESYELVTDAEIMVQAAGSVQSVLPAPHLLKGSPDPSDEERYADYCDEFARILRDMRDRRVSGHILHARDVHQMEFERIFSKKTRFIIPDGDKAVQGMLLEHQNQVVLNRSRIASLSDLIDHYDVRSLTIIDPDQEAFRQALELMDPETVTAGGYATSKEHEYWKNLNLTATAPANPE